VAHDRLLFRAIAEIPITAEKDLGNSRRALRALRLNVFALLLVLAAGHPVAQRSAATRAVAQLQRDIDTILTAPALDRGAVGVVVRSLATGETVYTRNAPRLMMPASTLKIVTLAAAADRLGWDHTYETRIVADGKVDGATLEGDLVIVGSGDPSLDRPVLDSWAAQIRTLGVTRVTGRVLADARAFSGEGLGAGWPGADLSLLGILAVVAIASLMATRLLRSVHNSQTGAAIP